MVEPRLTAWLRPTLALVGLVGILTLAGCGGGSGAPNNPFVPPPVVPILTVQPTNITAYSGVPTTVTITSGQGPFTVFSNDTAVLPVTQSVAGNTIVVLANQVSADATVQLTVQDALGNTRPVTVSVKAAPILNALAFAPSGSDCGTNLCSGQSGTATVTATGAAGVPLTNRTIRFDIVYGPIGILTTNPATPVAQTLTVVTDNFGVATVGILAVANSPTQPAQLRATDVTSGNQQIANLTVVNSTVATQSPLTVVPDTATITGAFLNVCSTGFRIDYYIYGGSPPYTISSTFPASVTLVNTFVARSGGFFEAITNGSCVNPLQFTIVDSAGKQTTASLINTPGTASPPAPPPLIVSPGAVAANICSGKTFTFLVNGGTAPYNAYVASYAGSSPPNLTPNVVPNSGGTVSLTFTSPEPINGDTVIVIGDSSIPQNSQTATITCSAPGPVMAPPVVVSPTTAGNSTTSCVGQSYQFTVTAGTAPFNVAFANPMQVPPGTIAGSPVAAVGDSFIVSGLNGSVKTNVIRVTPANGTAALVQVVCQ
ncbi:MAG: hypothetical protein ABIO63_11270 [Casimicrobiaceae bacterium]